MMTGLAIRCCSRWSTTNAALQHYSGQVDIPNTWGQKNRFANTSKLFQESLWIRSRHTGHGILIWPDVLMWVVNVYALHARAFPPHAWKSDPVDQWPQRFSNPFSSFFSRSRYFTLKRIIRQPVPMLTRESECSYELDTQELLVRLESQKAS